MLLNNLMSIVRDAHNASESLDRPSKWTAPFRYVSHTPKVQRIRTHTALKYSPTISYFEGQSVNVNADHYAPTPWYLCRTDTIGVLDLHRWKHPVWFYHAVLHEIIHSTGHGKRLNRLSLALAPQESLAKAQEELIAEGAACALSVMSTQCPWARKAVFNSAVEYLRAFHWAYPYVSMLKPSTMAQTRLALEFFLDNTPTFNRG